MILEEDVELDITSLILDQRVNLTSYYPVSNNQDSGFQLPVYFFISFAHMSRKVAVRLKTNLVGDESGSLQK